LPVASCFEREALKVGFEIVKPRNHVQLRRKIVPLPAKAATTPMSSSTLPRLGLAEQFWNSDVDAAYEQLAPAACLLRN
jgi:hypothetical protein